MKIATALLAFGYAAVAAYFRYRPQPAGVTAVPVPFRVPAEAIRFFHRTTWYENGRRYHHDQIVPEVLRIIRRARRFVVMDIFLFNLHHAQQHGSEAFVPTTRQIGDAFRDSPAAGWLITDPINTTWGTAVTPPLRWLEEAGVRVCITDVRKLRDSTSLYSPLWRLALSWIDNRWPPRIRSPFEPWATTTPWALLDAIAVHANHRKLVIADRGQDAITWIGSANLEDAGCYFGDTAVTVRSASVAKYFLATERALARASGCEIPAYISASPCSGDAAVTPLLGHHIKRALIADLDAAVPGERLYLFAQFLSEREFIEALIRASERGVGGTLVLDRSEVDFGNPKSGFPNQLTGPELARRTTFEIRWANTRNEEYHNQLLILDRPNGRCILHAGSANYSRRGLSNTVLEANVRIDAPRAATVSRQALEFARWMRRYPRSVALDASQPKPWPQYWLMRAQEATGTGFF